ncbi:MAG TPA: enoyl-CoA hydratase [Pseudogracilibacillus sp.]|nr:enoyl-CoA hydratase [Pseudogracilibacillus sp.]
MADLVQLELRDDHIAIMTLNRPDVANAMSKQLLEEINEALLSIKEHASIFCTIIIGAGDKAFCAGADLKERNGMNDREVIEAVRGIGNTILNIEQMPMPVIAALNGVAFGGGLELALGCDIRIAADHIQLGLTETSLAIIPGAGGTQRLPRLIGIGKAKQLIYTAKRLTASEAKDFGIVEEVVKSSQLLDRAIELAKEISKNGPIALEQAKTAINNGMQVDLLTGIEIEHLSYKQTLHTEDRLEGLQAFKEKRQPIYRGK